MSTPIDMSPRRTAPEAQPFYGVPAEAQHAHHMRCRACKQSGGKFEKCPAYAALDRQFYREHVANGGAAERHWSAPKIVERAPAIAPATEGSDLRERS